MIITIHITKCHTKISFSSLFIIDMISIVYKLLIDYYHLPEVVNLRFVNRVNLLVCQRFPDVIELDLV